MSAVSSNTTMKHDMSYRKPVPIFVPSPPASPRISSSEPDIQECGREEKEVPPLPDNWRDIVNARIQEAQSSPVRLTRMAFPPSENLEMDVTEWDATTKAFPVLPCDAKPTSSTLWHAQEFHTTREEADKSSLICPATPTKSPSVHTQQMRGLPTQYRPPTPPLRSPTKSHYHKASSERPAHDMTSLKLSPSFRTERTMVSLNTMPVSTPGPWSHSFGTLADGGLYNHPTPWKKQTTDVWTLSDNAEREDDATLCCTSLRFLTRPIRRLASFCSCN